jgi:hypothetical protein
VNIHNRNNRSTPLPMPEHLRKLHLTSRLSGDTVYLAACALNCDISHSFAYAVTRFTRLRTVSRDYREALRILLRHIGAYAKTLTLLPGIGSPLSKVLPTQAAVASMRALKCRGVAQPGRALPSGGRSRKFESCRPDQLNIQYPHKARHCGLCAF